LTSSSTFTTIGIGQKHTTSELMFLSSDTFLAHSKMLTLVKN